MTRTIAVSIFLLAVGGTISGRALAQTSPASAEGGDEPRASAEPGTLLESGTNADDPWRVEMRMWAWIMGVEGDVGVLGRTTEVSASFGDILEGSDSVLAFSGRLEVWHGGLGAFIDGMYAKLGAEDQTGTAGRAAIDIEFEQTILDFGLMYRVVDVEPEAAGAAANWRNLTVDLYAGGRYSGLDIEIDPDRVAPRQADESWLDPIVGAKLIVPIAQRWHAELNGDVGGFGASSDLTWSGTAVVGHDFEMFGTPASVLLGYRIIGWDYSEGSGRREFAWDLFQHGIILGLDIRF